MSDRILAPIVPDELNSDFDAYLASWMLAGVSGLLVAVIDEADQNIVSRAPPDTKAACQRRKYKPMPKMFEITNFDDVFGFDPKYSYSAEAVESIEQHRAAFEGLFVDRVLKLLGIKRPNKSYPPKSNGDLKSLHQAVVSSNAAHHTKLSLLYYILLDCDEKTRNNAHSNAFEEASFIPKKYQIFMKGLWHMDRAEFETALQNLTHPSLIPTFQEEILEVLVKNSPADDMRLPLAYYHTVLPALISTPALDSLFLAIARTSVTEAFFFLRGQSELDQNRMFEALLRFMTQEPLGERTAARGIELANLPFNKEEEALFEQVLTGMGGRTAARARDLVMLRRIGTGKFNEALDVDCNRSKTVGGLNWESLQEGIREGLGPRYDISRMR
ncbi:hypothetical protein O988_06254 [Pseudogymnoascus sp. VKM F-3808]|nr:hypothetical protein O988_06254 [Pseudogymnoascus sp. VKM F-3808]